MSDEQDEGHRELLESTLRQLQQMIDERGHDHRETVGGAVRALTRLWSEMNPGFPFDAWGPVSWMLEQNWDRIVAHHVSAQGSAAIVRPAGEAKRAEPSSLAAATVRQHCDALAGEPLFGARELIHSNLLAWFLDHEPAVGEVLSGWATEAPGALGAPTQREHRKLDLVAHLPGRVPLVIENKTFSFPNLAQLDAYTDKISTPQLADASLVLLSLADPRWQDREYEIGERRWRYRSYAELGSALEHAASRIDVDNDDGRYREETLRRYGVLLQRLHAIADIVCDIGLADPYRLPGDLVAELGPVRLDAGYAKIRAHSVYTLLRDEIPGIHIDFTQREPLLERFEPVPGTDDKIGWQLQGNQWRLAVRVGDPVNGHGVGDANVARRATYVEDRYLTFFDIAALGDNLAPAKPTKPWLGFNPDFVYRYVKLSEETRIDQLLELHHRTSELAAPWVHT